MPVAIGVTGVLLLALNLLDLGTGAVIAFGLALGVIWTVIAVGVYRLYMRALADEMRRRALGPSPLDIAEEDAAVRTLLRSDDARDVRLGLDLLAGAVSPAPAIELRQVALHADPEVRGASTRPARLERRHARGRRARRAGRRPCRVRRACRPTRGRDRPRLSRRGRRRRTPAGRASRRPRPDRPSRGTRCRGSGGRQGPGDRQPRRRSGRKASHDGQRVPRRSTG